MARSSSTTEDPSAVAVARVYADALLRAAGDGGEDVVSELEALKGEVLDGQPEFAELLDNPFLGAEQKLGLIDRALAPHLSPKAANTLRVLARHGRLELLPAVIREARLALERAAGKRRVVLTTADPLSEEELKDYERRLDSAVSFTPVLVNETDPALLGGAVLRVGDTVFDSSLKTRLRQLRGRLKAHATHEIQRRRDRFRHPEGD